MITFNPEVRIGDLGILAIALGGVLKFGGMEQKLNTMYQWFESNVINNNSSATKLKSRSHSAGD